MNIYNIIQLIGGLALFLYGMTLLGNGLEKTSSGRLEAILEKMTSNIFKATLVGTLVTGVIQSSSATTVIVVGLVNAKMIKLRQAIGIIMGANIGTTVTAHILRLTDLQSDNIVLSLFKPVNFTPIFMAVGVVMLMASQKPFRRNIGTILVGFGVLFSGMFGMEAAVSSLRDMPAVGELFAKFTNPILGVLVGTGVTAIIQSSSASVGILQAISSTGAITYSAAFPIIMGQNIGTCITCVLASIRTSTNAKRAAFVHVTFNVIGTILFLFGIYAIQKTIGFPFWNDAIDKGGIATFHTIFNVTVTLCLIPFAGALEKLAIFCIRDGNTGNERGDMASVLDDRFLISPGIAIGHARDVAIHMAVLARENYNNSFRLLTVFDQPLHEKTRETEDTIDYLQGKVDSYLLKVAQKDLSENENIALSGVLQMVNEFERIGDHADNICDCAVNMRDTGIVFTDKGKKDLSIISDALNEILDLAVACYQNDDPATAKGIEPLEEVIDSLIETAKARHTERFKQKECSFDAAFPFIEILSNMERISDYCSNVGVRVLSYHSRNGLDRHEYLRELHKGKSEDYVEKFRHYDEKYYSRLSGEQMEGNT